MRYSPRYIEQMCSNKSVACRSRKQARAAARKFGKLYGIKLRPYRCRLCEFFHLTSREDDLMGTEPVIYTQHGAVLAVHIQDRTGKLTSLTPGAAADLMHLLREAADGRDVAGLAGFLLHEISGKTPPRPPKQAEPMPIIVDGKTAPSYQVGDGAQATATLADLLPEGERVDAVLGLDQINNLQPGYSLVRFENSMWLMHVNAAMRLTCLGTAWWETP